MGTNFFNIVLQAQMHYFIVPKQNFSKDMTFIN